MPSAVAYGTVTGAASGSPFAVVSCTRTAAAPAPSGTLDVAAASDTAVTGGTPYEASTVPPKASVQNTPPKPSAAIAFGTAVVESTASSTAVQLPPARGTRQTSSWPIQ